MPIELSVTIKDDERKFTKDFLEYEAFSMDEHDPLVRERVKECKEEFKGQPQQIIVKTKMVIE